jgi:predicted lipid-binding transport protein (Tim44 family)
MIAAIVIFIQLRSVLGKRTGSERPPFDPYTAGRQAEKEASSSPDNVVSLPRKRTNGEAPESNYALIDAVAKQGSDLNKGLRGEGCRSQFRPQEFRRWRQDGV